MANLSFSEGRFPTLFKQATVIPLITGHSLDKSVPSNYRPISNLNFISKILERIFSLVFSPIFLNLLILTSISRRFINHLLTYLLTYQGFI